MEEKTITLYPATIDNKNIVEDWIYEFMEGLDLSDGINRRLIGCPFGDGNVIECTYTFGGNTITFKAYGEKDRINTKLLMEKVVAPFLWGDRVLVRLEEIAYERNITMSLFYD